MCSNTLIRLIYKLWPQNCILWTNPTCKLPEVRNCLRVWKDFFGPCLFFFFWKMSSNPSLFSSFTKKKVYTHVYTQYPFFFPLYFSTVIGYIVYLNLKLSDVELLVLNDNQQQFGISNFHFYFFLLCVCVCFEMHLCQA